MPPFLTHLPDLDALLAPYEGKIGPAFTGYKNHVLRMLNFCFYLANPEEEARKKLIIAGAFHDIGIWTAGTMDYLAPSVKEAMNCLDGQHLGAWREEIALMISEHHKIRPAHCPEYPLVEVFRQADLVDFSLGMIKQGIPSEFVQAVRKAIPNAGFHRNLARLAWHRLRTEPFKNPAPMVKW